MTPIGQRAVREIERISAARQDFTAHGTAADVGEFLIELSISLEQVAAAVAALAEPEASGR